MLHPPVVLGATGTKAGVLTAAKASGVCRGFFGAVVMLGLNL